MNPRSDKHLGNRPFRKNLALTNDNDNKVMVKLSLSDRNLYTKMDVITTRTLLPF